MNTSISNSKMSFDSQITVESSSSFADESNSRVNEKSLKSKETNHNRQDKRIYATDKICQQFQTLEKLVWNSNQFIEKSNKNQNLNEIILKVLFHSKNKNVIYDFFKMIQNDRPQKCCTLLVNSLHQFERKINLNVSDNESNDSQSNTVFEKSKGSNYDEKMLLYYCTICSLYPSLYSREVPSSCSFSSDETLDETENSFSQTTTNGIELETTSEGLCDYVREIFDISRQAFNEYQVKAIRKLLFKKSHPQILKEELVKQYSIIKHDKHPFYEKSSFKSANSYYAWKDRSLCSLSNLLRKLQHVPIDESLNENEEILNKYAEKLSLFPVYYEKLVNQIFKNLAANNSFKLTSNSKRLLKEFQLRYSIDCFDAMVMELKHFTDYFGMEKSVFGTLIAYLKEIHLFLTMNKIPDEPQNYSIQINLLFTLFSILENIYSTIINIIKNLKSYYPEGNSKDINNLVELLKEVTSMNELLNRTSAISPADTFKIYLKEGLKANYTETKKSILKNLPVFDSNLVYSLLVYCRDQITFYQNALSHQFFKILDINSEVVTVLYENLMEDVKLLCEYHLDELSDNKKLNLNLLAISYRFNSFDCEFDKIITYEKQVWRGYILAQLGNWVIAMGSICSKMISQYFIPNDDYNEIPIKSEINSDVFKKLKGLSGLAMNSISPISTNETKSAFKSFSVLKNEKKYNQSTPSRNSSSETSSKEETHVHFSQKTKNKALSPLAYTSNNNDEPLLVDKLSNDVFSDQEYLNKVFETYKKDKFQRKSNVSRDSYFASSSSPSSPIFLPAVFTQNKQFDQFPCSVSFVDMFILAFRYKDVCEKLVQLIIPDTLIDLNTNFFIHRLKIYNSFYQEIFKFFSLYSDNLLALDVCAASKKILDSFFGNEIIDQIFNGRSNDLVWGCRHKLKNCKYSCNHYINNESIYISDKYEPINKMMCVRINNLSQLVDILKYFYQKYSNFMHKQYNYLIKIKTNKKAVVLNQNFKFEFHKTQFLYKSLIVKLIKIQHGLIKLLVFRFNLFCKQAKTFLLSDELANIPINARLKPLIDFLNVNFVMLKYQLYPQILNRFTKLLWESFYDNFFDLMQKFETVISSNPKNDAEILSKTIDILLLKFKEYNNCHGHLEAKIKQIKLILYLFSQNTDSLILLYYKLFNFNFQKTSNQQSNRFDFIHLVRMWKRLKKPFHGKFFINYLRKNPPESHSSFNKDEAIKYSQSLLEANYLGVTKLKHKKVKQNKNIDLNTMNSLEDKFDAEFRIATFNLINYDQIYLATKMNYYQLNGITISKLTDNLLFRNTLLNHEIEILYPNSKENLIDSRLDQESSVLFDKCIENSIDHDFIVKILWQRIYIEPIAMKFISMRYSNYANNLFFSHNLQTQKSIFKSNSSDFISFFPFS